MTTKRLEKTSPKFFCEKCDFKCFTNTDWNRHISRAKHIKTTNNNDINLENFKPKYVCVNCEKEYNDRAGLWRHKKKCSEKNEVNNVCDEINVTPKMILDIIQQNQEFKELIVKQNKENQELQKQMLEVIKNGTNNTNITNNNKTFNLQFFLNETCKDAMNITDFVNSIKMQLTDLENVGKNGYVNGISNLIVKNLNALEVNKRPVHCSDLKREIMYVKDENRWEKEKEKLENAIKKVSYKNVLKILEWQKEHPECEYSFNKENDKYLQIVNESMGALTEEEKIKNINKIITRIAKEVVIEKET